MQFEKTQWISLEVIPAAHTRGSEARKVLVNLMNVKKIVPDFDGQWSKITYMDGTAEIAKEPFAKIEAALLGTLESFYRAPEVKE